LAKICIDLRVYHSYIIERVTDVSGVTADVQLVSEICVVLMAGAG